MKIGGHRAKQLILTSCGEKIKELRLHAHWAAWRKRKELLKASKGPVEAAGSQFVFYNISKFFLKCHIFSGKSIAYAQFTNKLLHL